MKVKAAYRAMAAAVVAAGLTACGSHPSGGLPRSSGNDEVRSPATARQPVPRVASLSVCGAMSVQNAPTVDGANRVIAFTPTVRARSVTLARVPTAGCLSSGYGERTTGGVGKMHTGIDLFTRVATPVYAAADGVVVKAERYGGYGQMILIRHGGGVETRYGHLSAYSVGAGQRVRAGDVIGETGRTGNASAVHLHYEIIVDGRAVNPLIVSTSGDVS